MLFWCKAIEIQIFSFAGFASIHQVPTVLASPGRRVANAFGGFAIDTTALHQNPTKTRLSDPIWSDCCHWKFHGKTQHKV